MPQSYRSLDPEFLLLVEAMIAAALTECRNAPVNVDVIRAILTKKLDALASAYREIADMKPPY